MCLGVEFSYWFYSQVLSKIVLVLIIKVGQNRGITILVKRILLNEEIIMRVTVRWTSHYSNLFVYIILWQLKGALIKHLQINVV